MASQSGRSQRSQEGWNAPLQAKPGQCKNVIDSVNQHQGSFENPSVPRSKKNHTLCNGSDSCPAPSSSTLALLQDEIQPLSTNQHVDFRPPTSNSSSILFGEWNDDDFATDFMMNDVFHSEIHVRLSERTNQQQRKHQHEPGSKKSITVEKQKPLVVQHAQQPIHIVSKESGNCSKKNSQVLHHPLKLIETPIADTRNQKPTKKIIGSKRNASAVSPKPRQRRKMSSGRKTKLPLSEKEQPIEQQIMKLPSVVFAPSLLARIVANDTMRRPANSNTNQGYSAPAVFKSIEVCNPTREVDHENDTGPCISPHEAFSAILRDRGLGEDNFLKLDAAEYDLVPSPLQLASYGSSLVRAVQSSDTTLLSKLLNCGLSPNPCNQFRDSVLGDLVCKQGNIPIYHCLVLEFKADIHDFDGLGRTLLHHCCWAQKFCRPIVEDILKRDPIQIFLKDKQGKSSLDYVRTENWGTWNQFLREVADRYWPRDRPLPRLSAFRKNRRDPNGANRVPPEPMSIALASDLASGIIPPEAVAAMSKKTRETYGVKKVTD
ncbi:unnamed protein product [Pseudo-nitzschia multistriata]|uniref:Uncharacterized protein n=1 Tax=Pseudo-nitzschia multistriata TaxID=183589 RepID=A0A448Z896_9STRA|nr:unnamed protein product [Pseudo-nitzschia multistriata]